MGIQNIWDWVGTNGATPTATGLAFNGTGTAVYDDTVGFNSVKITASDGLTKRATMTGTNVVVDRMTSIIFKALAATPAADKTLVQLVSSDGGSIRIMHTAAGNISYQIGSGTVTTIGAATNGAFYRVQIRANCGVGATDAITIKAYTSASNFTTQLGSTVTLTNQTFSDLGVTENRAGALSGTTPGDTTNIGYTITEEARTTDFGGPPAANPPVANAGPDQDPVVGDVVQLTAAASTAGSGSITGYAWICTEFPAGASSPSISNPAIVNPTFVAAAGGRYTFQCTVTNSGTLTNADSVTCWVAEQSNVDTDVYSVAAASYTIEGGAPSREAAVNDATNTTYLLSADGAGGFGLYTFNPVGLGTIDILIDERWFDGAANRTLTFYKADGTTVVDTLSSYALPAAFATKTWTISGAGLALIPLRSDRRALILKIADA